MVLRLCLFVYALAPVLCLSQAPAVPNVQAKLDAVHRELALNHLAAAEQQLRAVLTLDSSAAEAHFLLGYVLFRENRPQDSLAEYTTGAQGRTPTAEELATVGSDYVLLKDFPDADKWFRYALTLDPANIHAWYLLGRTQYNEDHAADALKSFERCLALDPRNLRAEYNLGLSYEKLQRPSDAIAAYRAAITWQTGRDSQDAQPYLDLGVILLSQGETAPALEALRQAVRFGPENPLAQQEFGRALEAAGQYEEAMVAFRHAAALAPTSQQPHFFLARVLRRLGRNAEAAAEYAIVSQLLGSHSDTPTPNADQQP